jgi:hypothetical protein
VSFEQNFIKLTALVKTIGLSKESFDDILNWGELYGRILYTNYPDIYRDDDFEKALIGKYINKNDLPDLTEKKVGDLHIISEPYSTGGHTRLLERMLKIRDTGDVLVTRPLDSVTGKLSVLVSSNVYADKTGYSIKKIIESAKNYKTIFLHIHPDDLTACVAMGVLKKLSNTRIIFINHADHIFSFGYYSCTVIAEMGPFGAKLSKVKNRGEATYLGVPFNLSKFDLIDNFYDGKDQSKVMNILTGATSFKYKSALGLSFPQLVINILKNIPNVNITVVGPKKYSEWWWWKAIILNPIRLSVVSKLPFTQYVELIDNTDLYIDSFPLSGGTSVPEVRAKGIPVTGVLCGSYGYTPWDKTKYQSGSELIVGLKDFLLSESSDILNRNNNMTLIQESSNLHSIDGFKKRLESIIETGIGGAIDDQNLVNYSYFYEHWLGQEKLILGKNSYRFLFDNWSGGGKEVMKLAICINPIKYTLKLMSAIPMFLKLK